MKTHQGKDRIVVEAGEYVFKLPKISPLIGMKELKMAYELGGVGLAKKAWSYEVDAGQAKWQFFHGVAANRREYRIFRTFPNIVAPTTPIFGGMVNVQDVLEHPSLGFDDIWGAFNDKLGPITHRLGHTLEDVSNFGVGKNQAVVFVDGGSFNLEYMLRGGNYPEILGALGILSALHAERTVQ